MSEPYVVIYTAKDMVGHMSIQLVRPGQEPLTRGFYSNASNYDDRKETVPQVAGRVVKTVTQDNDGYTYDDSQIGDRSKTSNIDPKKVIASKPIPITEEGVKALEGFVQSVDADPGDYELMGRNCIDYVEAALEAAGVTGGVQTTLSGEQMADLSMGTVYREYGNTKEVFGWKPDSPFRDHLPKEQAAPHPGWKPEQRRAEARAEYFSIIAPNGVPNEGDPALLGPSTQPSGPKAGQKPPVDAEPGPQSKAPEFQSERMVARDDPAQPGVSGPARQTMEMKGPDLSGNRVGMAPILAALGQAVPALTHVLDAPVNRWSEGDMRLIMRQDAYWREQPETPQIRKLIKDWHDDVYGTDAMRLDATGRPVDPKPRREIKAGGLAAMLESPVRTPDGQDLQQARQALAGGLSGLALGADGQKDAVRRLQAGLNTLIEPEEGPLKVDGELGPKTAARTNRLLREQGASPILSALRVPAGHDSRRLGFRTGGGII